MSVFRERPVVCGACGTSTVQPVALSIHGTRAPALLDEIRAGRFHRFACPRCGAETIVDGPLLVIDFVRPWWVQVYPRRWLGAWRALERDADRRFVEAIAEHAPDFVRELAPGFMRRLVFGMAALREKILLRDAGIDDVAVETVKLLACARRETGDVPELRVIAVDQQGVSLAGAPEGLLRVGRDRIREAGADPELASTRARLCGGAFTDAARIYEPGDARSPLPSVTRAK